MFEFSYSKPSQTRYVILDAETSTDPVEERLGYLYLTEPQTFDILPSP